MPADPSDSPPAQDVPRRRPAPRQVLVAGLLATAISLAIVFLPALWGEWDWNKYFVAFGLIGTFLGLSLLLHGAWDWVRTRHDR
jgi:hypothetical protein